MDAGARETSAAAAAMSAHMHPRDETVADKDETDPFAGSEDDVSSEEYAENPGKAMAKHVISEGEEEVIDNTEESSGHMSVDGDAAAEPAAASTPTRHSKDTFRIVTIEHPLEKNTGFKPRCDQYSNTADDHSGEDSSAAASAATTIVRGPDCDANSAGGEKGDGNSATVIPQKSDDRFQSDAGTAKSNAAGKSDGKSSAKVPSMCPPPAKPADKQAAEADAVPSSSYKAILDAKKNKLTPPRHTGNRTRYGKT
jgi:hypothetical protein